MEFVGNLKMDQRQDINQMDIMNKTITRWNKYGQEIDII